jgi:hypothetical protein
LPRAKTNPRGRPGTYEGRTNFQIDLDPKNSLEGNKSMLISFELFLELCQVINMLCKGIPAVEGRIASPSLEGSQ